MSRRKIITRITFLLILFAGAINALAQNLNTSNKTGPMGVEVNTLSGNLFVPRTDLLVPSRGFNLSVTFFYNSFYYQENNGFGNGWLFGYHIKYSTDSAGTKTITWGDGREDAYVPLGNGSYKTPRGYFDTFSEYQTGKFLLTEPDGRKLFFDNNAHHRITKMQESNGNYINFLYTDTLLTSIVSATGQSLLFQYFNGRLTSVIDAIVSPARTYTYSYDGAGNLLQVTDPLSGTNKYTYLVNGPMKTITDKNHNTVDIIYYSDLTVSEVIGCNKRISFSHDRTTETTYVTDHMDDGNNQVTKYEYKKVGNIAWLSALSGNCCGFNMKFDFDSSGNKIKETDANGKACTYTYDERGNMLTMKDPLNQLITYTYSSDFNNITSYTDPLGNVYAMTYDSRGNLTQLSEPGNNNYTATYAANGDILSSTDPKGNTYTYSYDSYGNPNIVLGPHGYHATLTHDARGNLLSFTDARNNTHTGEYDILNRLKKINDPLNNNIQFTYDAEGNATSLTNKNNEISLLTYDASNRVVKFSDPAGKQTKLGYDAMNNVTSIRNALGYETKLSYNTRNRISGMTSALNDKSSLDYDANGNITRIMMPNGQEISYVYDEVNRLTGFSDNTGTGGAITYDKNSNATSFSNGTGLVFNYTYDSLNRIKKVTDALGYSITLVYDKNGNILSATDRNGFTRSCTYDNLNRAKTFTDNNGFVIKLNYDEEGHVSQVTDQNKNITVYVYDNLNRLKTITYADGKYMQLDYDKKSNVIAKLLTDGTTITYDYDSLNRVKTKTLPGGYVYTYQYDALGRMVSATNNAGTVSFTYDAMNRIASETSNGLTVRYAYNTQGRSQTTVYPDSTVIIKNFDTRNRLTNITKNNQVVVSYQYNNDNMPVSKTFANGVVSNLQYDFAHRLSSISTAGGSIQNSSFTYDKERNKTAIARLNNPAASEQFAYDNAHRLTSYKKGVIGSTPVAQSVFIYDSLGNRKSVTVNSTTTNYMSNNLNQLISINDGTHTTNPLYDNNGNLAYDGNRYKKYDAEGKLLTDSSSPSNVLKFTYDALGRRVVKIVNGVSTNYTYCGLAQIEERNGINNALSARTIYSSYLSPVLLEKNNQAYYYHQNELNSVEAITNSAGTLEESYQYDAYGMPAIYNGAGTPIASSLTGNRFGFTGQEYDSASESYRFHFRNYSPVTGTFAQRDLIGYSDGMGLYQYVHDNPANGIDVMGLQDCPPVETATAPNGAWEWFLYNSGLLGNVGDLTTILKEGSYTLLMNPEFGERAAVKFLTSTGLSIALTIPNAINTFNSAKGLGANWDSYSNGQRVDGIISVTGGSLSTGLGAAATINTVGTLAAGNSLTASLGSAGASITATTGGVALVGLAGGLAIFGLTNEAVKALTGKSIAEHGEQAEIPLFTSGVRNVSSYYYSRQTIHDKGWDRQAEWDRIRNEIENGERHKKPKPNCPQNNGPGGTNRPRPVDPITGKPIEFISSEDPNEIIGPDGVDDKKWVSIKDRLPYTILFENAKSASAPAKYVKVIAPVDVKADAGSFQLGSFGFNNLTFTMPSSMASYYQRLDCRDSMGLFVDVIAGYDVQNNQVFWEFQSIDPLTLLPPSDPLKGFLFLQDSAIRFYGHGFVNFSIKPVADAHTLDSIRAKASIIFDANDTIPTNIARNTIDALAPTSSMSDLEDFTPNTEVSLHFSGVDDPGGSGIKSYAIYVADNNGVPELYVSNFSGTDTSFKGIADHTYRFYVSATDRTGNVEQLKFLDSTSIIKGEQVICPGSSVAFDSKLNGGSYQWQVDNGSGFVNITDGGMYSGATGKVLMLTTPPTSIYGNQYRCVMNGTTYSQVFLLKFGMSWEGTVSNAWENPANWSCGSLPDQHTDVTIGTGKVNYPQVNSNVMIRSLTMKPGASGTVKTGFRLTIIK